MLPSAILQTLKYSDHFDFPLTLSEIHSRLIYPDQLAKDRSELSQEFGSFSGLQQVIKKLILQHQIQKSEDYYHLPGRESLVSRRRARALLSTPQFLKAKSISLQLSMVPGVLALYLTGSLAMSNSDNNADIDLMVITKPGKLWTTRLLLTIYTELLGLRRRPQDAHASGKVCLNLYLTPGSYLLPRSKQSLYTAYELIQAVPLYDPSNTHSALLTSNSWIYKYLPNYPLPKTKLRTLLKTSVRNFWDHLEYLLYHLQLAYMRRKLTREYITPNSAFFHPHNPAPKV